MAATFHAKDGWFFKRAKGGGVVIEKRAYPSAGAPLQAKVELDEGTWASILASVSAGGEGAGGFQRALDFHRQEGEPGEAAP